MQEAHLRGEGLNLNHIIHNNEIKRPEFRAFFWFLFGILTIFGNWIKNMSKEKVVYGKIQTIGEKGLSQNCCNFWDYCSSFIVCLVYSIVIFWFLTFFGTKFRGLAFTHKKKRSYMFRWASLVNWWLSFICRHKC